MFFALWLLGCAPPVDADLDGVSVELDCDDSNPQISPNADERCNGLDDDCDGLVDNNASDGSRYYLDGDGDGFGDASNGTTACSLPDGYVNDASDCDDADPLINPGAAESCDAIDHDCDGQLSNGFDQDGDGVSVCDGDCDDTEATVYPGNTEFCDGLDNNCDGVIDEDLSAAPSWFVDADGDGYGLPFSSVASCDPIAGRADNDGDCDDSDRAIHPDAAELCDGVDNNCDGVVDENVDLDGDGQTNCDGDCDDARPEVYTGAVELCDLSDNNCNGVVDDAKEAQMDTFYLDADGDQFGDINVPGYACLLLSGYVVDSTDCDDSDPLINPDAFEVWYDGVDQACDGGDDYDADADGHPSADYEGDDLDDFDATCWGRCGAPLSLDCHPVDPQGGSWTRDYDVVYYGSVGTEQVSAVGQGQTSAQSLAWETHTVLSVASGESWDVRQFNRCEADGSASVLEWSGPIVFMGQGYDVVGVLDHPRVYLPAFSVLSQPGTRWSYAYGLEATALFPIVIPTTGEYEVLTTALYPIDGVDYTAYRLKNTVSQKGGNASFNTLPNLDLESELWYVQGLGLVKETTLEARNGDVILSRELSGFTGLTPQ